MARLDRLASVKEVAQIGAAIGREFSYELLATVAPVKERELLAALDEAAHAGLPVSKDTPDQPQTYTFKHALVQEAAYQSLLRSKRQRLHARIGSALEEQFPETAETKPELLAHHWELGKGYHEGGRLPSQGRASGERAFGGTRGDRTAANGIATAGRPSARPGAGPARASVATCFV